MPSSTALETHSKSCAGEAGVAERTPGVAARKLEAHRNSLGRLTAQPFAATRVSGASPRLPRAAEPRTKDQPLALRLLAYSPFTFVVASANPSAPAICAWSST